MRPTTTTALALAGAAMALPAVALAESDDPPTPTETTLAAPFAGHLSVSDRLRAERREALVERLMPRAVQLAGKVARVKGVEFSERAERRRLRGESPGELRAEIRERRRELRRAEQAAATTGTGTATVGANTTAEPHLEAIAACESGGDPSAIGGGGLYRGKYQFDVATWQSVGGSGDPAAAPEAEQDMRAAMLYAQQGSSPWPVCGG
jgi:Transglycosylase-like domain